MRVKKYTDDSTTEKYRFLIYCECCGKLVLDHSSTPDVCYKPKLFMGSAKRRAKEVLWLAGHQKAFDEASKKALQKLNRCEICGNLVCDNCATINNKLGGKLCCNHCLNELSSKQQE